MYSLANLDSLDDLDGCVVPGLSDLGVASVHLPPTAANQKQSQNDQTHQNKTKAQKKKTIQNAGKLENKEAFEIEYIPTHSCVDFYDLVTLLERMTVFWAKLGIYTYYIYIFSLHIPTKIKTQSSLMIRLHFFFKTYFFNLR